MPITNLVLSFLKQDSRLGELCAISASPCAGKGNRQGVVARPGLSAFFKLYGVVDRQTPRAFLEAIYDLFASQVRQVRNIVVAEVRTAFPLDRQAELHLISVLEQLTGKQIEFET